MHARSTPRHDQMRAAFTSWPLQPTSRSTSRVRKRRHQSMAEMEIDLALVPSLSPVPRAYVRVPTLHMASPINFNQFLEKEKLKSNGSNFTDWFRHVRIFLNGGNLQYVLDAPLGDPPAETETDEVKNVYATRKTRLGINRVLQSLPPSYKNFVMNYNMQNMNKEFSELFGMLKAAEIEIKKEHQVLMVNKTTGFKNRASLKARTRRVARKLPRLCET
ncbi:hypothetical protein QYE76_025208 [Lolium multiflorum]|uniref:Uncharacterized protein n=1 Tax=Lolium multiflorum TaxID=4521 RepID=A0AAD8RFC0_LOLMU|nr:hypothetical protein QYE76_025208 [Lolium multiflorum]